MNHATVTGRQRLAEIRERTHAARGARQRARTMLDAAKAAGDDQAASIAALALDQAQIECDTAEALENMVLSSMAGVNGNGHRLGETVFEDPTTIATLERLGHSQMPIGKIDLGPLSSRDELIETIQTGSWKFAQGPAPRGATFDVPDSARTRYFGEVPQLRRRLSILDLINVQPMDVGQFDFVVESGSLDTALETAEGEIKPQADLALPEMTVKAKTVANWIKLKKQQLADVASLQLLVTSRLTYTVMRRVESQAISGDGTGENLLGVLATPGIGDTPFVADQPLTDIALDAIVETLMADAQPSAVIVNPLDWAVTLKQKAVGSGIRLDSDGAYGTPPDTLWGLPAIPSKVMPQGQALVGDWAVGATLFVREPVSVRLGEESDDMTRNMVTALGEGRFGFGVFQPLAFTLVHFAAAS